MKRTICTLFAAVLLVGGAATAKAEIFIDSWSYNVAGGFISWTSDGYNNSGIYATDRIAGGLPGHSGNVYRDLSWGPSGNANYNNRSGVSISDAVSGTVYTDQGTADGLSLTHRNKSINSIYSTLTGGQVYLTLDLTPNVPGLESLPTFTTTLAFEFIETPNVGSNQDDIFYILNPLDSMENFVYDGYEYYFSFFASFMNLNEMFPEYVYTYLDPTKTYYGWVTRENDTTVIPTFLQVNSGRIPGPSPTPEPGSIMLMGAGLVGLACCVRRRRK